MRIAGGYEPAEPDAAPEVIVADRRLPVVVRVHPRARRMILRLERDATALRLTLPPGVSLREGLRFVESRRDWIAGRLREAPRPRPFRHGVVMPYRGDPHMILHVPHRRGVVWREGTGETARLCVGGDPRHLPRRLRDWLMARAKAELSAACRHYAAAMERRYRRLVVRDQKSRWGSCSSSGTLSFSWRLILAPPFVLDYLAAHEVAHLAEMNHSSRFWRLLDAHCPHVRRAESWLKDHGAALHAWGAEEP